MLPPRLIPEDDRAGIWIELIPSRDDPDWQSPQYQHELGAVEYGLKLHGICAYPEIADEEPGEAGRRLTGAFTLLPRATLPTLAFLGGWIKARMGRKIRGRVGAVEIEAATIEELLKLLPLSGHRLGGLPPSID